MQAFIQQRDPLTLFRISLLQEGWSDAEIDAFGTLQSVADFFNANAVNGG